MERWLAARSPLLHVGHVGDAPAATLALRLSIDELPEEAQVARTVELLRAASHASCTRLCTVVRHCILSALHTNRRETNEVAVRFTTAKHNRLVRLGSI